jgi:hypothetical protein
LSAAPESLTCGGGLNLHPAEDLVNLSGGEEITSVNAIDTSTYLHTLPIGHRSTSIYFMAPGQDKDIEFDYAIGYLIACRETP